jgi:hypothetical protein
METSSLVCQSFEQLREMIRQLLCEPEELEQDAFPLTEQVLERSGQPCGVFFCLHGPRSVRYTAIWEPRQQVVRCYDSTGTRFNTCYLERPVDYPPNMAKQRRAA